MRVKKIFSYFLICILIFSCENNFNTISQIEKAFNQPSKQNISNVTNSNLPEKINNTNFIQLNQSEVNLNKNIVLSNINTFLSMDMYKANLNIKVSNYYEINDKYFSQINDLIKITKYNSLATNSNFFTGVWYDNNSVLSLHPNFEKYLKNTNIKTDIFSIDFEKKFLESFNKINFWLTSKNNLLNESNFNHLTISKLDEPSNTTKIYNRYLAYILNLYTLNFKIPFEIDTIKKSNFHINDKTIKVDTIYSKQINFYYSSYYYDTSLKKYIKSSNLDVIKIPIGLEKKISLILVKQPYNLSFEEKNIKEYLKQFQEYKGYISIPKFNINSEIKHIDYPLFFPEKGLCSENKNQVNGILNLLIIKKENCITPSIETKDNFIFDENGVNYVSLICQNFSDILKKSIEADAETLIEFNQPFSFYIVDEVTGVILTMGKVTDPDLQDK